MIEIVQMHRSLAKMRKMRHRAAAEMSAAILLFALWPSSPAPGAVAHGASAPGAVAHGASVPLDKVPHRVPRVDGPVSVDARLTEGAWEGALRLELGYEVTPGENVPAPVRTEVLLAYGDEFLYVGFRAFDPDPSGIRATLRDRDNIEEEDWVGVVFDTFDDQRRMFKFMVNPLGVQADRIECTDCPEDVFDAIWESAGRVTDSGYEVELAIPLGSLRFPRAEGDQIWNFDAVRNYPRSVGRTIGLFPRDRSNNCYLCQAEKLIGFAGISPGKNIEVDPTLSALYSQEREEPGAGDFAEKDKRFDPGITARWGMTPNLMLQGTVNPDFSQVEADVLELDINTTFAIYYPERRPFFMEGAEFFGTPVPAVYSRTLADPRWGIKLTGKEGPSSIGFFSVEDEMTNMIFPGSQGSASASLDRRSIGTVLRYKRDIFEFSSLGALVTDREGAGYRNRTAGIDGLLRFTKTDYINFSVVGSETRYPDEVVSAFGQPDGSIRGAAAEALYLHETRGYELFGYYYDYTRDFRADLGFAPKVDVRHYETGFEKKFYGSSGGWFTESQACLAYEWEEERSGAKIMKLLNLYLNYDGPLQTELDFTTHLLGDLVYGEERETFSLRHYHIDASVKPSGSAEISLFHTYGSTVDYANERQGKVLSFEPGFEYRAGRHLTLGYAHTWERHYVEDDLRLYTANICQLRMIWQFNLRTFMRANVQYVDYRRDSGLYTVEVDPVEKNLFSQILFSYKINPQTVLYLGYSDTYEGFRPPDPAASEADLRQTDRTFFLKIGYAWVI